MSAARVVELYVPVKVTLRLEGRRKPAFVSAEVDPQGAPYAYAGEGAELYDPATEGEEAWREPSEKERAAGEDALQALLLRGPIGGNT